MRRKHKSNTVLKKHKSNTVNVETSQNLTKEYEIQFRQIIIDPETGDFQNFTIFKDFLPILEEYHRFFGDDFTPSIENYAAWLKKYLDFVKDIAPWFFCVVVNGEPQGLIWAYNWEDPGLGVYTVDIGGLAKRGTPVEVTKRTIRQFLEMLFAETGVYVVRGDCAFGNRAARLAMLRAGMSHPEIRRAWKVCDGAEITGIIYSITRHEMAEPDV